MERRWGFGILDNPKYTGFQVWNRRRRKTGGNRTNPETDWVWSETPAHPAIISIELWKAAQGMRRQPKSTVVRGGTVSGRRIS